MKTVQIKLGVESSLFLQLKKQTKDQAIELREKNALIDRLRRNMKVTKFQELETEKTFLYEELQRLRRMIDVYEQEQKTQDEY